MITRITFEIGREYLSQYTSSQTCNLKKINVDDLFQATRNYDPQNDREIQEKEYGVQKIRAPTEERGGGKSRDDGEGKFQDNRRKRSIEHS